MATNGTASEHPVFKELVVIFGSIAAVHNPEAWQLDTCPAIAPSTKAQCKNSPKNRAQAREIRSQIQLLQDCPETDQFLEKLRDFFTASHCWRHKDNALKRLEEWAGSRTSAKPDSPQPLDQISVVTEDVSDNDDSLTVSNISQTTSLARSDGVGDDFPTPPSTAPAIQPDDPLLTATAKLEITADAKSDASIPVKDVTDGVSAMTIDAAGGQDVASDQVDAENTSTEKIIGLGLTKLERRGTLRDPAPVFSEIFRHLTKTQQRDGWVYVRESQLDKDLFMISWTGDGDDAKLDQTGGCYTASSKLVHTTRDGPFFAAPKAGKLAQTVLRHHKLTVKKCEKCGNGHKNWFRAPRSMVIETVEIMENFVKLPAYETLDNETWKLSEAAHQRIRTMCEFSPDKLKDAINTAENQSASNDDFDESSTLESQDTASQATEASTPLNTQTTQQSMDTTEGAESSRGEMNRKESGGATTAKVVKKFRRKIRSATARVSDEVTNLLNKTQEYRDDKSRGGDTQDAVAGVFVSLFPEEARTSEGETKEKGTRQGVSWITGRMQRVATWLTDFDEEMRRTDTEGNETKDGGSDKAR